MNLASDSNSDQAAALAPLLPPEGDQSSTEGDQNSTDGDQNSTDGDQNSTDGDQNSPQDENPQNGSISGVVLNISSSMMGAGIMSVPATMKVLGIVPALLVIAVVALLTDVTVEFILRYTNRGNWRTYAGMMGESFGFYGSLATKICLCVTNFGTAIVYFIILGDALCGSESNGTTHLGILQEWLGINCLTSRAFVLLVVAVFVLLPLLMYFRRIDSLRFTSALSILLALLFLVICSLMAFGAMWSGKTQSIRIVPDFSKVTVLDLFTTVPVFVTGFGFQLSVHPIRAGLRRDARIGVATRISLAICVAIYFAIGLSAYLLFGESIMSDMLVNFGQKSTTNSGGKLNDIVRITYILHLCLVFPIMNYCLRDNINELMFPNRTPLDSHPQRFMLLTLALLLVPYSLAVAIPNVWYFFQFMGSTTIACLSFIFPAAIVLRDMHGISNRKDKVMAIVLIVLAVGTSGIAIWSNLNGLRV